MWTDADQAALDADRQERSLDAAPAHLLDESRSHTLTGENLRFTGAFLHAGWAVERKTQFGVPYAVITPPGLRPPVESWGSNVNSRFD